MQPTAQNAEERIFAAVMDLIQEGGLAAVTLGSVCKKSALSKGGLTHHYPTKDALIEQFVGRSIAVCGDRLTDALSGVRPGRGRRTKAFVDFALDSEALTNRGTQREMGAIMVAFAQGRFPELAATYYQHITKELVGDGVDRELLELIFAATDGMWFQSSFLDHEEVKKRAKSLIKQLHGLVSRRSSKN